MSRERPSSTWMCWTIRSAKKVYDKYYPVYRSLYQGVKTDFAEVSEIVGA